MRKFGRILPIPVNFLLDSAVPPPAPVFAASAERRYAGTFCKNKWYPVALISLYIIYIYYNIYKFKYSIWHVISPLVPHPEHFRMYLRTCVPAIFFSFTLWQFQVFAVSLHANK